MMMKSIAPQQHSSSFLSKHTSFFGVKLWVLIVVASVASFLAAAVVILAVCFLRRRLRRGEPFRFTKPKFCIPLKHNISPGRDQNLYNRCENVPLSVESQRLSHILVPGLYSVRSHSFSTGGFGSFNVFSFMEIQSMTEDFSDENLIAKGDSGAVFRGVFMGAIAVATKRLSTAAQRYEAEDFMARTEMIANVRHRNVVRLLGCCVEGAERVLVYEYVEKGNLHEWLYGCRGRVRPLSWKKRMNILQGVAKGLAYFHEDMEPRISHHHLNPTKILIDYQWNPKMLGVGFTGPSDLDPPHVSTYITSMPARNSSTAVDLKKDVHSFGILIMELVSGRVPVDQDLPHVYLVDWVKEMVTNQTIVNVLDPRLPEFPEVKELKRLILIALRCVDPDVDQRPKMGDVIHMLQPRDLLLTDTRQQNPKISQSSGVRVSMREAEAFSNQYQKMTPGNRR